MRIVPVGTSKRLTRGLRGIMLILGPEEKSFPGRVSAT
jgi:hypothetical protein